jgi:hypothetical protein
VTPVEFLPRCRKAPLLGLACLLILSGCSSYQMGIPDTHPFSSIYVKPVENQTFAPQSDAILTAQLIRDFERDGRLQPEPLGSAEATLDVRLVDLRRENRVMREDDTGLTRKIRLTLVAHCTLTGPDGTAYFTDREIMAQTEVYLDDGQNPAEYQATPVLTRNLSAHISRAVLDTW